MILILLVQVQSRVITAKCSEPQVGISNGMDEGSSKVFEPTNILKGMNEKVLEEVFDENEMSYI